MLQGEYRAIATRRVRLGLLLSEIGRLNGIAVSEEEIARAMHAEAARYPGQERRVLDLFRQNPQAIEGLRAPLFEEKVVDFVLGMAQVSEQAASVEELARDPDLPQEVAAAGQSAAAAPGAAPSPSG